MLVDLTVAKLALQMYVTYSIFFVANILPASLRIQASDVSLTTVPRYEILTGMICYLFLGILIALASTPGTKHVVPKEMPSRNPPC